jgi:hypothetical protein
MAFSKNMRFNPVTQTYDIKNLDGTTRSYPVEDNPYWEENTPETKIRGDTITHFSLDELTEASPTKYLSEYPAVWNGDTTAMSDKEKLEIEENTATRMWIDDTAFCEYVFKGVDHDSFASNFYNSRTEETEQWRALEDLCMILGFADKSVMESILYPDNLDINRNYLYILYQHTERRKTTFNEYYFKVNLPTNYKAHVNFLGSRPPKLRSDKKALFLASTTPYEIVGFEYEMSDTNLHKTKINSKMMQLRGQEKIDHEYLTLKEKDFELIVPGGHPSIVGESDMNFISMKCTMDGLLSGLLEERTKVVVIEDNEQQKKLTESAMESVPKFGKYR